MVRRSSGWTRWNASSMLGVPAAGSNPQKPKTCLSQRPSPDGILRSQRPRRPNSWAVSSSSPWRRAWLARKRVELTSVKVHRMRAPSRLARASTQSAAPSAARSWMATASSVPVSSAAARRRRVVSPAAPSGASASTVALPSAAMPVAPTKRSLAHSSRPSRPLTATSSRLWPSSALSTSAGGVSWSGGMARSLMDAQRARAPWRERRSLAAGPAFPVPPSQASATCSTSLPKFSPRNSRQSVSGKVSRPTTTSSRLVMRPSFR